MRGSACEGGLVEMKSGDLCARMEKDTTDPPSLLCPTAINPCCWNGSTTYPKDDEPKVQH